MHLLQHKSFGKVRRGQPLFAPLGLTPPPTGASATPSLGYNTVAWTDPVGISDQSLAVYYSDVGASGPWVLLNDSIAAGTQSYTDDGTDDPDHLPVDVTRYYKIAAVKSSDAPGSAAVTCSCLCYPSAPVLSLVSSYQLDGSIFIELAQVTRSSVTALDIQVAGSETGDQITPAATKQVFFLPYGSAAVGDNLAQTIELSVSLENASGEGPPSGQVSVLVTGLQPAAPTVIADDGEGNAISWSETDPGLSPFSYVMIYGDNNNPPTTLLSYVDLADGPYDDSSPAYPGEMWYATAGSNDGSTPLTPMGTPTKDSPITISAGSATDVSGLVDFSSFVSVSGGTGTYTGTCTIDPGDGSGPQAITIVSGKPVFTASGLSTWDYTAAGNGTYTYAVVITDDHGNNASGGSSATVSGVSGAWLPTTPSNLQYAPVVALMRSANQLFVGAAGTGTNAVNDGDTVGSFVDTFEGVLFSSTGLGTGILTDLGGGKWGITFDGSTTGFSQVGSLSGATSIVVCASQTAPGPPTRIVSSMNVNALISFRRGDGNAIFCVAPICSTIFTSDSNYHTGSLTKSSGGDWAFWFDGASQTVNAVISEWGQLSLGYKSAGYEETFAGVFIGMTVYQSELGSTDRTDAESYLLSFSP